MLVSTALCRTLLRAAPRAPSHGGPFPLCCHTARWLPFAVFHLVICSQYLRHATAPLLRGWRTSFIHTSFRRRPSGWRVLPAGSVTVVLLSANSLFSGALQPISVFPCAEPSSAGSLLSLTPPCVGGPSIVVLCSPAKSRSFTPHPCFAVLLCPPIALGVGPF